MGPPLLRHLFHLELAAQDSQVLWMDSQEGAQRQRLGVVGPRQDLARPRYGIMSGGGVDGSFCRFCHFRQQLIRLVFVLVLRFS